MVGRKNITYLEIITNPQRLKLLGIISNKKYSIKQLQQISKINRGTLKHHLNILEEAKLIIKKREEKESGRPTYIIKNFIEYYDKKVKVR